MLDFEPLPVFGAMAEATGEPGGVEGNGGDGRWSAALFRLGKRRGAAELSEEGTASGEGGGTALFPLLINRGGGRYAFPD